jgi:predicted lactoylglutathione lyase
MLKGVCVGTNNLDNATRFYDQVLSTIGMNRFFENDVEVAYSSKSGGAMLWVLKPFDGNAASVGNGTQLIFSAANTRSVDQFHAEVLLLGGADEGAPGPRNYREGYYGAYCRDLDGNKLHVFCITK